MAYMKQTWRNANSGRPTPLVSSRFNHMEEGIESAHVLYESVKHGFRVLGFSEDEEDLPDIAEVGDAYIVGKRLYVWNESGWIDNGFIRGPQGPRGEHGADGDRHPVGAVILFAGDTPPEGWLLCDGLSVFRNQYAELFNTIKTIHGAGDNSSTFNVPYAVSSTGMNFIIKT